ncbi:hypothetical protein, partial [Streptomyces sp. NPDC058240]|uniref:hypothetical protein n=1 Tax=Streptomyces sp. NPDC058240 TaxID=3346396 RepID=UPI0036EF8DD0
MFVADKARDEARLIATRALRYGPYGIVASDMNYPPADPASPPPTTRRCCRTTSLARTRLPSEVDGQLVPDRRVTEMLEHTGFVDAAAKLYEERSEKKLLRKTAMGDRIDQLWVSAPLRNTIIDYALLDTPEGASDHHCLGHARSDELLVAVEADLERALHLAVGAGVLGALGSGPGGDGRFPLIVDTLIIGSCRSIGLGVPVGDIEVLA